MAEIKVANERRARESQETDAAQLAHAERLDKLRRDDELRRANLETERAMFRADTASAEAERVKNAPMAKFGMTPDQVRRSKWGNPTKVNVTEMRGLYAEQWVYDGGYLYFRNGLLTTIQSR